MLEQASSSGNEYVLLKLDVVKAFNKLEWPFLLAVLNRMGMTGLLTKFLQAGFTSAKYAKVLNSIHTDNFSLKPYVRQGCPLSSLLFIIGFDLLNILLQRAQDGGSILGVCFPDVNVRTLYNMYADDIYAIIRALMIYIQEFKGILDKLRCIRAYIEYGRP